MIERSETLGELFKALSKAQGEIKPAVKDATNPHLRSKYADLGSIWEACREALANNGLTVSQWPLDSEKSGITLLTILGHTSGEFLQASYTMPTGKGDAQGYGSALTYAKRYALAAVLGIVGEDDDDGHAASQPRQQQTRPQQPAPARQQAQTAQAPAQQAQTFGNELAAQYHKHLGPMLKGSDYPDTKAFISEALGREIESLADVPRSEKTKLDQFIRDYKETMEGAA